MPSILACKIDLNAALIRFANENELSKLLNIYYYHEGVAAMTIQLFRRRHNRFNI